MRAESGSAHPRAFLRAAGRVGAASLAVTATAATTVTAAAVAGTAEVAEVAGTTGVTGVVEAAGIAGIAAVADAAGDPVARPAPTVSPAPTTAFRPSDARLASPAGLVAGVAHPDVWWTLGAGGGKARLFALGADGRTRAVYTLSGVTGRAPDALTIVKGASGGAGLFLGDLSRGRKGSLTLYRVAEPATLADGTLPAKPYKVGYPDGGHDAATLLAEPREGRMYIITEAASAAAVYALPGALGPQVNGLTRLRTLPFGVRGGGFAPDGRVVLRTTADVRVLAGIRDKITQVIRTAAQTGTEVFGVAADGRRALMADRGSRPVFRAVPLPAPAKRAASRAGGADAPPAGQEEKAPVSFPAKSGPPGGLLGTGALVGLGLLGVLGAVFYLVGRRRSG